MTKRVTIGGSRINIDDLRDALHLARKLGCTIESGGMGYLVSHKHMTKKCDVMGGRKETPEEFFRWLRALMVGDQLTDIATNNVLPNNMSFTGAMIAEADAEIRKRKQEEERAEAEAAYKKEIEAQAERKRKHDEHEKKKEEDRAKRDAERAEQERLAEERRAKQSAVVENEKAEGLILMRLDYNILTRLHSRVAEEIHRRG